ncbi:hypothetical protein [Ruegeria marina]|uniref:Uncharacterized protein n=1 Tax=Ruegeria marina TaxID=639004 RepID=A0A1G6UQU1_9RHOB|nr:hypothetical protein [Ruegeria marina]SDD42925.1 hypothetical protein SAMN04488239_107121 [Ruegeria marina]
MTVQKTPQKPKPARENREDRLKTALKANLARRKAQARARSSGEQAKATDKD